MLSRTREDKHFWVKFPLDVMAMLAQLSGALVWPILQWTLPDAEAMTYPWAVPLGLILASFGWWEGFVEEKSKVAPIRWMWRVRDRMLDGSRYFTYLWVSVLKVIRIIHCELR